MDKLKIKSDNTGKNHTRAFFIHVAMGVAMLVFTFVYLRLFGFLENMNVPGYYYPFTFLDTQIPFIKYFVIPYLVWFGWVPAMMVYLYLTDSSEFAHAAILLIAGMSVFLLISALFPTKLLLRPATLAGNDIFDKLIRWLYSFDTPTNVFPSIHVYNTCVILGAVLRGKGKLCRNTVFRAANIVLALLICFSTVFIKQHSIADVSGAILMYFVFTWSGIAIKRKRIRQTPAKTGKAMASGGADT